MVRRLQRSRLVERGNCVEAKMKTKQPHNKQHAEFKNLKEVRCCYIAYKDRSDKTQVRKSLVSHIKKLILS